MENDNSPMKPIPSQKLDYLGPDLPIQLPTLPIDFNEKQNDTEKEIDILMAHGGEGNVLDVAEFHAVMNSILETLDVLIHIVEDAGRQDGDRSMSRDLDFNGALPEQHNNVNEDSVLNGSLNDEFIKLIDS